MTLNGGNPGDLTLRQFLSAGFALLVEAYTSLGVSIVEAVERTSSSLGMDGKDEPGPFPKDLAAQNEAAMRAIQAQMAGVRNAPKVIGT